MTHGAGRSAGGERADLRARLVSQVEGTLAGRRGLLREEGCASWAATLRGVGPAGPRGGACWVGERCVRETGGWGPVEGVVGRTRPRGEKGGSWPCGRRGELGRGAGSAREKGGENGLGRFGLRLSLGWRRKEVAGWAAHGFGAGLAVGLV